MSIIPDLDIHLSRHELHLAIDAIMDVYTTALNNNDKKATELLDLYNKLCNQNKMLR